jgi:hypothetical protein
MILCPQNPGEYFLRPMMKEYKFAPASKMIELPEGVTETIEIKGLRTAYRYLFLYMTAYRYLLSPRATKLPEGYRFLPVYMYVCTYGHRSSDFISRTILTILHTSIQYGKTSNFAFHDAASKVKVTYYF